MKLSWTLGCFVFSILSQMPPRSQHSETLIRGGRWTVKTLRAPISCTIPNVDQCHPSPWRNKRLPADWDSLYLDEAKVTRFYFTKSERVENDDVPAAVLMSQMRITKAGPFLDFKVLFLWKRGKRLETRKLDSRVGISKLFSIKICGLALS